MVGLTDCKDLVSLQSLIFYFTPTAPGLPRWSPIKVLTRPEPASLPRLDRIRLVQGGMAVDLIFYFNEIPIKIFIGVIKLLSISYHKQQHT